MLDIPKQILEKLPDVFGTNIIDSLVFTPQRSIASIQDYDIMKIAL